MSTSQDDKAAGILDRAKGKAERVYGEIADDPHAKAQGDADKLKGSLEKGKGEVKDTLKDKIDRL